MNFDQTRCNELLKASMARLDSDMTAGREAVVSPTVKALMYCMIRMEGERIGLIGEKIGLLKRNEFRDMLKITLQLFSPDCFYPGTPEQKEFTATVAAFTRDMSDLRTGK